MKYEETSRKFCMYSTVHLTTGNTVLDCHQSSQSNSVKESNFKCLNYHNINQIYTKFTKISYVYH